MADFFPEQLYIFLQEAYGPQGWWPLHSRRGEAGFDQRGYRNGPSPATLSPDEAFEVIIGAVLTQNTNWRNVEKALSELFTAGINSPESLLATNPDLLADLIRPSGYFRQKSGRLITIIPHLFSPHGLTELSRDELLAIQGIGPETADTILLYVYGRCFFIADLYTRRLLMRLVGADEMGNYEEVRDCFESRLPNDLALYREFHALIVRHGKEHCSARPRCAGCPAATLCAYATGHDA